MQRASTCRLLFYLKVKSIIKMYKYCLNFYENSVDNATQTYDFIQSDYYIKFCLFSFLYEWNVIYTISIKSIKPKNMKAILKTVLSLSIVGLICLPTAKAQESEVGIKGGINFSNFYSDEVDDQDLRFSFQGGMYFKAALTSFFAIQPEVLYMTKGSTVKYNYPIVGNGKISQKLNYLEVPILAVLNLTDNLNVHAGPYFSYLISAKIENESDNANFNFVNEQDESKFERMDYGIAAGIGLEFETLRFGARYDYGLTEIGKNSNDPNQPSINSDLKNSTFSLYLGIGF